MDRRWGVWQSHAHQQRNGRDSSTVGSGYHIIGHQVPLRIICAAPYRGGEI